MRTIGIVGFVERLVEKGQGSPRGRILSLIPLLSGYQFEIENLPNIFGDVRVQMAGNEGEHFRTVREKLDKFLQLAWKKWRGTGLPFHLESKTVIDQHREPHQATNFDEDDLDARNEPLESFKSEPGMAFHGNNSPFPGEVTNSHPFALALGHEYLEWSRSGNRET
jgi:hypothetical protein